MRIEARAQSLCNRAVERLKLAEKRIEAAERARREIIHEADCKLQDASRALNEAETDLPSQHARPLKEGQTDLISSIV